MTPITKKEAARQLTILAAEIRLSLDEADEDCPDWADQLVRIADRLEGAYVDA